MVSAQHRRWMYKRHKTGRTTLSKEFVDGVEEFVAFAKKTQVYLSEGRIRCPCVQCWSGKLLTPSEVTVHLYRKGFKPSYWYWTDHGEVVPDPLNVDIGTSEHISDLQTENVENRYEHMVHDAAAADFGNTRDDVEDGADEDPPHEEAAEFYELLKASTQPLWPGCETHSELSLVVRMLSVKSDYNITHACFNALLDILREVAPPGARIPKDYYRTKKMARKLGLASKKIDCCVNGCMLFEDDTRQCKFCGADRYKPFTSCGRNRRDIPVKRLHYLPLVPRLKRLFSSMSSATQMTWHAEHRRVDGLMCHPSDGEAWKHFDRTYPDFARDPRNVRLGLCSDGFTPYNHTSSQYSCWPVIVTPYNLPPELCMTTPYMFLTCIIPGPHNPKAKIDVYLQPLIEELKLLWTGVLTYDVSCKQNFIMRAALMWTINDFPAYGMLSGWMTAGKLACPYCMEQTTSFTLKHGGKNSWFDCHRQFLPPEHTFRRNKKAFKVKTIVNALPPQRLGGHELLHIVSQFPKCSEVVSLNRLNGYGTTHNWTKQSIFWELPYWKDNLIRHNLDVMHIEKNVFDNVFNTVMDVNGKTKDNVKARMDLKEYCCRRELELIDAGNGKWLKPKAVYCLTKEQRKMVCEWVKELKMPDGYASNLARCVDLTQLRLYGMKSHDCHVFMENLIPVAFSLLPEQVLNPLIQLSHFFRDLCSTNLTEQNTIQLQENIAVILCKLERIFPPGFFDSMEHLPIHLPYEARVGGPVQYRWMYPFERYLNKIKKTVKNKARVEGSICEAYLTQEIAHFSSYYFEPHVKSMRTRVGRNDDLGENMSMVPTLSIFDLPGRAQGKSTEKWLNDAQYKSATLHILLNCEEVQPYIK